jgi:hypothetical protein
MSSKRIIGVIAILLLLYCIYWVITQSAIFAIIGTTIGIITSLIIVPLLLFLLFKFFKWCFS